MNFAPVALFTYKRVDSLKKVIEALKLNPEAISSNLYIFSDAPKTVGDEKGVSEVRNYLSSVSGFNSVQIIRQSENKGLSGSIIAGVTELLSIHKKLIILEDDILTSPYFLNFMNSGLIKYENTENVASIHGYIYPVTKPIPETFFLKGADCWGWATWERAWQKFNPSAVEIDKLLQKAKLYSELDFGGVANYQRMIKRQISGEIDSWAVRWHASTFINNMLTLYPRKSLVQNIGADGKGTHVNKTDKFFVELSHFPVQINNIPLSPSLKGFLAFQDYFIKTSHPALRAIRTLKAGLFNSSLPGLKYSDY